MVLHLGKAIVELTELHSVIGIHHLNFIKNPRRIVEGEEEKGADNYDGSNCETEEMESEDSGIQDVAGSIDEGLPTI